MIEQDLAPHLIGSDLRAFEVVVASMERWIKRNLYAKAAIEIACVDLTAKAAGLPASALFGGRVRERLPVLLVLGSGVCRGKTRVREALASYNCQRARGLGSRIDNFPSLAQLESLLTWLC